MQYEANWYCIKYQNGDIRKKCMWKGIELQCGPNSDMCNRQVVGSYGIPSDFLDLLDIVECDYGTTIDGTKLMANFMVLICTILIIYHFLRNDFIFSQLGPETSTNSLSISCVSIA